MHRTLRPFELLEPESVDEAIQAVASAGAGAKILAGGLDLLGKMTRWEIEPPCLVSLGRIPGLAFLERSPDGGLLIGPLATLRSIELSSLVAVGWPLLHEAVRQIASVQVKAMGTLVGNLCVATPASDIAPALYALGAVVHIAGLEGPRAAAIEDFFIPDCRSILASDEIVTQIMVPPQQAGSGSVFKKLAQTKACIAKINTAVLVERDGDACRRARIALGAVASMPLRAAAAEALLEGHVFSPDLATRAGALAAEASSPISDLRSSADYRRRMAAVLTRRALIEAWDKAGQSQQAGQATESGPSQGAGPPAGVERP